MHNDSTRWGIYAHLSEAVCVKKNHLYCGIVGWWLLTSDSPCNSWYSATIVFIAFTNAATSTGCDTHEHAHAHTHTEEEGGRRGRRGSASVRMCEEHWRYSG